MKRFRALIFDVDGTLAETEEVHRRAHERPVGPQPEPVGLAVSAEAQRRGSVARIDQRD